MNDGNDGNNASVARFHDQLAADYHLIYDDWDGATERQGRALDTVIRSALGPAPATVLDCACGIGTQALGARGRCGLRRARVAAAGGQRLLPAAAHGVKARRTAPVEPTSWPVTAQRRIPACRASRSHDGNSDSSRSYSSGSDTLSMSSTAKKPTLSTRRPAIVSKRCNTP